MLTFKQFLTESDPIKLANRLASRYGSKSYNKNGLKVPAKKYIPLTKKGHPSSIGAAVHKYETSGHKVKDRISNFPIKDLHATQHYVEVGNEDKLRQKVANKNPNDVHVITHKGKHYIADGHHAVLAARLRGERTVSARHTNLDQI